MSKPGSPFVWFILIVLFIAVFTFFGPEEKSLGDNVRIVYLHGAWVLSAQINILAAAVMGLIGLLTRRESAHRWSQSLGRTGIVFWVTYLPLSLWAMQDNWNWLFLAEPRFRVAIIFAVVGVLLQIGLAIIDKLPWTSLANLAYAISLNFVLNGVGNVLHPPPSPIFSSGNLKIEVFFIVLILLTLLASWQLTRW
ncbi:MAG: hypothetical protein Q8M58_15545, partial [Anaerolineales bacterium]|nr:hypothetical protein [Anaerolineales bacterium]